jgi:hypothetical protein
MSPEGLITSEFDDAAIIDGDAAVAAALVAAAVRSEGQTPR